ncbi:MAG: MBL fold metallo-hydrolase [Albidovulum sp.]|uniref:MBL fold metallo-hydrolase n=1 Tax=Albidovulum sp. TaxID=1872424 RepID=UPI001321FB86|nr:MBL fold metallo-hydrolase [Defluviimonas sp.]KAB2880086.1 MAG: MBL fold metallo-hydrolase [Defluviimonas sp.]
MTQPFGLTRRHALLAGACAPLVVARPTPTLAKAPQQGAALPQFSRFMLGAFEVTTLLAATRAVDNPHTIFGLNASEEEFAAASRTAFLPTDMAQFFFTPTLVNTGAALILFDTGTDPAGITAALSAAGYAPGDVDMVVLTHMHPDHIGGMATEGAPTFPNAGYAAGAIEHNHWSGAANELFDKNVRPFAARTAMLADGGTVAPGITAVSAFGHTPGHLAFMVENGGKALMITADTANHPVWSLARPDWEVKFDADKPAAAAARSKIFGMIASERIPFVGYHMPFPATGFVEAEGDGFRYVPSSYQLMLG